MISIGNLEAEDEADIEMLFYPVGQQKNLHAFFYLPQKPKVLRFDADLKPPESPLMSV